MTITEAKIIVKEDKDYIPHIDKNGQPLPIMSTVGLRYRLDGEECGQYVSFEKSTLNISDVTDAVNYLLQQMIYESLEDNSETSENEAGHEERKIPLPVLTEEQKQLEELVIHDCGGDYHYSRGCLLMVTFS